MKKSEFKAILKQDLQDSRITTLCKNIYYLNTAELVDEYILYSVYEDIKVNYSLGKPERRVFKVSIDIISKGTSFEKLEDAVEEVMESKGYLMEVTTEINNKETKMNEVSKKFIKNIYY